MNRFRLFQNVNKSLRLIGKIERPTLLMCPDLSNFIWSKENLKTLTHCMHPILLGNLVNISNLGRNQKHFVFHTKEQEFIVEFTLDIQNLRVLKLLFRSLTSEKDSRSQERTERNGMVWERTPRMSLNPHFWGLIWGRMWCRSSLIEGGFWELRLKTIVEKIMLWIQTGEHFQSRCPNYRKIRSEYLQGMIGDFYGGITSV